jgi:hypothetical protein
VPRAGCRRADLDAPPRRKNHRCSLSQRHGKVVRLVSGSNQSRQQGVARQVPGLGAVIRAAAAEIAVAPAWRRSGHRKTGAGR